MPGTPADRENGHDHCGGDPVRHFDRFLQREVPRIEASPAFGRDGLIVVTGPLVRAGAVSRARYDHSSLERTLAEGFEIPPLARAAAARAFAGVWR